MPKHWIALRFVLTLSGLAVACHNPADVEVIDSRECVLPVPVEHMNCFELVGQVVGERGQGISGMNLTVKSVGESSRAYGLAERTALDGSFLIRAIVPRVPPSEGVLSDTLSVNLVASGTQRSQSGVLYLVQDSVIVRAHVTPLGMVPEATQVQLTLPVP